MNTLEDHTTAVVAPDLASEALEKVRAATERFNLVSLKKQIEACEGLLAENQLIDIAILGQFKAGKTSFINSLVGTPILPVGVIPVTTVITRITRVQHGLRERVTVHFLDGTQAEIPLQEIGQFIAEAYNPANVKNVAIVDIELPSFERYHGLRLVDTPGLGSAYKYNTATSEEWLPKVGAALVAISAERPLAESDIQLIRELMEYTPEIVLLLTKADLLSPDQQQEVISFLQATVRKELGCDFPIFLYSIKTDTATYRQRLDSELFTPLTQNLNLELHKIIRHKIIALVRTCAGYLEVALNASLQADHERERVKNLILDEKLNYDLIRSELFLLTREHTIQTRTLIAEHLNRTCKLPLTRKLTAKLKEEMKSWKGNLSVFTTRFEGWLKDSMTRELHALSQSEHEHFFESLSKAQAAISWRVSLFKTLLAGNIERVLGIQMSTPDWNVEVAVPSRPDLTFTRTFDFHLDLFWFLIPMVLFRKAFERHFLNQIPWAVEVNLSRLAYQWEKSINRAIEEVQERALQYIQDELSTIETLISKPREQTAALKQTLTDLNVILNEA